MSPTEYEKGYCDGLHAREMLPAAVVSAIDNGEIPDDLIALTARLQRRLADQSDTCSVPAPPKRRRRRPCTYLRLVR